MYLNIFTIYAAKHKPMMDHRQIWARTVEKRRTSQRTVECSVSGVELQTLDYENTGSNPGCGVKTLGKFFHSTLLKFTQLYK